MLEPVAQTLLVTLLSLISSIIQTILTVWFANPKIINSISAEIKSYKEEQQTAKKLSDKKMLKALEKRAPYIRQRESRVSSMQMKLLVSGVVVSLIIFWLATALFGLSTTIAIVPAPVIQGKDPILVNVLVWFTICTLFFSSIARKVSGS